MHGIIANSTSHKDKAGGFNQNNTCNNNINNKNNIEQGNVLKKSVNNIINHPNDLIQTLKSFQNKKINIDTMKGKINSQKAPLKNQGNTMLVNKIDNVNFR